MNEQWLPVKGFEGFYEVSDRGRVRSLPLRKTGSGKGGHMGFRLALVNRKGYFHVNLSKNRKISISSVARLVAIAFIPNPKNKPCVNHKNGIKTDNRVSNLEWCTLSENVRHAFDTGLIKEHLNRNRDQLGRFL